MSEPTFYSFINPYVKKRQPKLTPPLKVYSESEYEELKKAQKQVHKAFVKKKIDFSKHSY